MLKSVRALLPSWIPGSTCYRVPIKIKTGDQRIYHVHNRKTAGTSLNHSFLKLAGEEEHARYMKLAESKPHQVEDGGFRFVGWDISLINSGRYFYAFSHAPFWKLALPAKTYTFTCLRDPVRRVVSHYQMLMEYRRLNVDHPCRETEDAWLGDSFRDFVDRIDPENLLNQLWMFSRHFDVDEAVHNLSSISHVLFNETLATGIPQMSSELGVPLPLAHYKKSPPVPIGDDDLDALRLRLRPEYDFIQRYRESLPALSPFSQA